MRAHSGLAAVRAVVRRTRVRRILSRNDKKPQVKFCQAVFPWNAQGRLGLESLLIRAFAHTRRMKVCLTNQPLHRGFGRCKAVLAGMILTMTAIYVGTVCPMLWAQAQLESDLYNRLVIVRAVEQWHRERGVWPRDDLSDIGADARFFPAGIPCHPLSGRPYRLEPTTHGVLPP